MNGNDRRLTRNARAGRPDARELCGLAGVVLGVTLGAPSLAAAAMVEPNEAAVRELLEEACTACHDDSGDPSDPGGLNLEAPAALIGRRAAGADATLVVPGDAANSYLVAKLVGGPHIAGDPMPLGEDPLSQEQLEVITGWINGLPADAEGAGAGVGEDTAAAGATTSKGQTDASSAAATDAAGEGVGDALVVQARAAAPKGAFYGTWGAVLPTTRTLGFGQMGFRIGHRFGRIGTQRGALGLDAGATMSLGLAFGLVDGLDLELRRSNSRKDYELGLKWAPLQQEQQWPVSLAVYASAEYMRDFSANVANPWSGNFMLMLSRLWFDRWSTMVSVGYSLNTNHAPRVFLAQPDPTTGAPTRFVYDRRGTLTVGLLSQVWLGKRRRFGLDLEYLLPIPAGGSPNTFYYHGGDADPNGTKIGVWTLGGSYKLGKHLFQVVLTNTRELHSNQVAPGGQTGNPFGAQTSSNNPLLKANFFLGFSIARQFELGKPKRGKSAPSAAMARRAKGATTP